MYNHKMTKQETINTYNNNARTFADEFDSYGPRVKDVEKAFSYVKKSHPKVVEIGCGSGRDAREILKRTDDYTGIDIAEKLLQIAQENNPTGLFQHADLETYEFPEEVDIIFAFASLLHSDKESVGKVLQRASKTLASGGIIFISLKEAEEYQEKRVIEEHTGARTYFYYTPGEIEEMAPELKPVFLERQTLQGTDRRVTGWFSLILQKPAEIK